MSWNLNLVMWHDAKWSSKKVGPQNSGQLFNTTTVDKVRSEKWKMAGCFTLLRRITRLKNVKSEIRSEDRSSYLERYSPKGSCHLDESSMSHTLAQNGRCEFCCGMHRTCKDTNSNKHDEMNLYTYNHSGRWPYKTTAIRYMSPQLRRICAQGRDYTYCAGTFTQEHCSVFSGRWLQCSPAAPCNMMKLYISTDGTHTKKNIHTSNHR